MSYPISTNPKIEGKRFLAWDSDNKEWSIYYYDIGGFDSLDLVLYNDRHQECYAGDITRWQPLPDDPELEESTNKARVSVINANDLEVLNVQQNYEGSSMDDSNILWSTDSILIN